MLANCSFVSYFVLFSVLVPLYKTTRAQTFHCIRLLIVFVKAENIWHSCSYCLSHSIWIQLVLLTLTIHITTLTFCAHSVYYCQAHLDRNTQHTLQVMNTLKITSYNVKGLHNPVKRKKILYQLKQAKKSLADKVYYSSHQSGRKKGVSILIHRQINFTQTLVYRH